MTSRSFLYFLARLFGDVNAVRRGPKAIGRRVGNRLIGRHIVRRLWL